MKDKLTQLSIDLNNPDPFDKHIDLEVVLYGEKVPVDNVIETLYKIIDTILDGSRFCYLENEEQEDIRTIEKFIKTNFYET